MTQTSVASAAESARPPASARHDGLTRELFAASLGDVSRGLESWLYSTWIYRQTLKGPLPDRIRLIPEDLRERRLEDADLIMKGRFRFAGTLVPTTGESILDAKVADRAWKEELHGFAWLRHLSAANSDAAGATARKLTADWLKRFRRPAGIAWEPHVLARRLTAWASHSKLIFSGNDLLWRSAVLLSMGEQARHLMRVAGDAPSGPPRLTAAVGLAFSGLTLLDGAARLKRGLELVSRELEAQILPDGGHISRNPAAIVDVLADLMPLQAALKDSNREAPHALQNAIDRMGAMLRFFMHGDGRLALFNGANESAERTIATLLARDDARGKPFGHATFSGYQRLAAGRTLVLLDGGTPPLPLYSGDAHAGALSLEISTGPYRIVVNCGANYERGPDWREAGRRTAAHSTLSLNGECSAGYVTKPSSVRRFGTRLVARGETVSRREENAGGIWIEAHHDAWVKPHGMRHERRLFLAPDGEDLRGEDRITPGLRAKPLRRGERPPRLNFALRFHIHPDVKVSPTEGGDAAILRLPNGEGWRFRVAGGAITVEDSVYLGSGPVRRAEQIVVTGEVQDEPVSVKWALQSVAAAEKK